MASLGTSREVPIPLDVLDFHVTIAIRDAATPTAVIGEISRMIPLRDIRG